MSTPQRKTTKVRIEHDDGTFVQLTDPVQIERWEKMVNGQALMAYVHGCTYEPIEWEEGKIE